MALLLSAPVWAATPGGPVEAGGAPAALGVDARMGTLIPAQLLDGPGLHLAIGGRIRIVGPLWAHLESGVDRAAASALTDEVPLPAGTVEISTTYARWSFPLLGGLGLHWGFDGGGFGLQLMGGGAWQSGRQDVTVSGDPGVRVRRDAWLEPLVQGRLQGTIDLEVGAASLSAGWRAAPAPARPEVSREVRSDGLLLEAGWSSRF